TFLTTLVFSELKGKVADEKAEKRLTAALDKTVAKIQKNQRENGTWANEGWAPILSQSLASKGLNRASQNGFAVPEAVLAKVESYAKANTAAAPVETGRVVASTGPVTGGIAGREALGPIGAGAVDSPAMVGGFGSSRGAISSTALGSAGVPLYDRA